MASEAAAQLQQKQGVHNLHMVKAYSDEPDNPSEATSEVWKLYSGEITKPVAVVKVQSGPDRDDQVSSSCEGLCCCVLARSDLSRQHTRTVLASNVLKRQIS
jgi:hypothetical protein